MEDLKVHRIAVPEGFADIDGLLSWLMASGYTVWIDDPGNLCSHHQQAITLAGQKFAEFKATGATTKSVGA